MSATNEIVSADEKVSEHEVEVPSIEEPSKPSAIRTSIKQTPVALRVQKHRAKVASDPVLREKLKEKQHQLYLARKKDALKSTLASAFEDNYSRFVRNKYFDRGFYFIVPNVLGLTQDYVTSFKHKLEVRKSWSRLHQQGRYYLTNFPAKINHESIQCFVTVLKELFEGTERLDGGNWHVHPVSYIKHTQDCSEQQPFHVDNKHRYEYVHSADVPKITCWNDCGYSIFLGLDQHNSLSVGWAHELVSEIKGIEDISFPFKSILVTSDHLVHAGNKFKGIDTVYWKKHLESKYCLKGFISVNEFGSEQSDMQGWFRIGKEPFMGRL